MEGQLLVYDDIKLYTTAEKFYLEPTFLPTEVLVIDRLSGESYVKPINSVKIPIPANAYRPICGFLGTIRLISGLYLIVAKYRICLGKLNGHDIYKLAGTDLIPFTRSNTHLTSRQIEDNNTYERMLRFALETPSLYFSYGYDITHTMQRLHAVAPDFLKMSLSSRADPRFLWNGFLLKDFSHEQFGRFSLPLIQGFVSLNRVTVNGHQLQWSLVSRRCVDRAGTRFFMRGVDAQGHVANYVETEQIIERDAEKASFVQTRGSIPLYWSQLPDLKYKPALTLAAEDHVAAYSAHMRDQAQRYGAQVIINLIDQRGRELSLESGFRAAAAAAALPAVRYEAFDFHTECRGMRYDRLNVLIDRIAHEQTEFSYFLSRGGSVLLKQNGVFRTNCIDCLDRTNVVQSLLARRQLAAALKLLAVTAHADPGPKFDSLFNNVWADHADAISIQYSGTGALKTDFTRTGKRTRMGLVMDGVNSLTRYYKNNFSDGFRQDSIDLFLGKYVVSEGEGNTTVCPLRKERSWTYYTLPSVLVVAMSMFCASAVLPTQYTNEVLLYLMLWGACITATLTYMFKHGEEFVDWPRLDGGGLASTRSLATQQHL